MASRAEPGVEPRTPLSRERVLRAALALADEHGIESLSMRRLGQELGVKAMSLYNHVANKDDMLDGIVELVAGDFALPAAGTDWKAALRASAISAHESLLRHPWACSLLVSRPSMPGPARLRFMDSLLRCLREARFSPSLTHHGFHALHSYILSRTLQEVNFPFDTEETAAMGQQFLKQLSAADYPDLQLHVEEHMDPTYDDGGGYEFGLDLILDGLERIRDAG